MSYLPCKAMIYIIGCVLKFYAKFNIVEGAIEASSCSISSPAPVSASEADQQEQQEQ